LSWFSSRLERDGELGYLATMPREPFESLVKQIDAKNAEEFLDFLTPHRGGPLWDRSLDHRSWIFRGQRDADWKLVPKAHRERDAFFFAGLSGANVNPRPGPVPYTPEELLERESKAASVFASRASNLGYEIPWDRPEFRDRDFALAEDWGAKFPPLHEWGIYALAQHYGVPTRLLDWSFKPLVAAYFAASEAAEEVAKGDRTNEPRPQKRLAVWAVNERFLSSLCHDRDPGVAVVTVPKTTNPNLARQEGLFTLVRFQKAPTPLRNPPTLDDLLADPDLVRLVRETEGFPPLPMLYKFTLPYEDARFLLYYLLLNGIDASHIYEGRGAIVNGMGEDRIRSVCSRADRVNWKSCEPPGP
jgi:hypothetical protein